eukprot:g1027.t1
MKFKLVGNDKPAMHKKSVTAVAWTRDGDIYAASDDKTISIWNTDGNVLRESLMKIEYYATDMHWLPQVGTQIASQFVVAFTNGKFAVVSKSGKIEKFSNVAHHGVIGCIRWNHEGNAIATGGEDGSVRIFSSSAIMRATITRSDMPVYGVAWSPSNDRILYTQGKSLAIRSIKVDSKKMQWKAHDGFIMKVDWNPVNDKIVSCGEDCKYKVWDSFGRVLFQSSTHDDVLTSVRWCPNGSMFAIGSYDTLRLCDETGWSHSLSKPDSGSIFNLAWSSDGTSVAGAGGNGKVVVGQVVDRRLTWKQISVELVAIETEDETADTVVVPDGVGDSKRSEGKVASPSNKSNGTGGSGRNRIRVKDVERETSETLDFVDRVVEMSLGYGHLVVATVTRCYLYSVKNWNTPQIFDLPHPVSLIKQSDRFFVMLNSMNAVHVYNYDGRHLSSPRFPGLRVETISNRTMSVAGDTLAILNRNNHKHIHLFRIVDGRAIGTVDHTTPIVEIDLSRYSRSETQLISFIDTSRDLYVGKVATAERRAKRRKGRKSAASKRSDGGDDGRADASDLQKIATMVDTSEWNDASDTLAAVADGKLVTWIYPQAVYVDRDLFDKGKFSHDGVAFGKHPYISSFFGPRVTVRRVDGALVTTSVTPYANMMYDFATSTRWSDAVRLCRFVKQNELWAALAAMALSRRHLETAEIALAAISETDKLQYVTYIKGVPSSEGRAAELALFKGKPDEAESILLQASPPLVYRAIKMNIRLFRWQRALAIAEKHKAHVDTVVGYRQRFLSQFGRTETDAKFIRYEGKITVDWDSINRAKEDEREKERRRRRA